MKKTKQSSPILSLFSASSRLSFGSFSFYTTLALFVLLALFPLAYLFWYSLVDARWALDTNFPTHSTPNENFWEKIWFSSYQLQLLGRTLWLSLQTTLIAFCLGAPPAWFLSKYRFPGRLVLTSLCILPVFIPPYLHALLWNNLFGRKGQINLWLTSHGFEPWLVIGPEIHGAAWVLAVSFFPYIFLLLYQALNRLDGRLEQSFIQHFGFKRALFSFYFPLLSPTLFVSLLLVFILTANNFGVPQVLLVQVYSLEIFTQYSAFLNYPAATFVSIPLLLLCFLLLALLLKFEKKAELYGKQSSPSHLFPLSFLAYVGIFFTLFLLLFTVGFPLSFLWETAQGLSNIDQAIENGGKELWTSFWMAIGSATLILFFSVILGDGLAKRLKRNHPPSRFPLFFLFLCLSPLAFPGILLATGMTKLWVSLDWIYLSLGILIFASTARFSSFGIHIAERLFSGVHTQQREAARLHGGKTLEWKILLSLTAKDLAGIWILAYALSFGEIDATILVKNPANIPVAPALVSLLHFGYPEIISTLALLAIFVGLIPVILYFLILEKLLEVY